MSDADHTQLDTLQAAYKAAVEEWIAAIRKEEALCSSAHEIAEVDEWETAHDAEEEAREKVKSAKADYEDALRETFYAF